jgi:hypothetical protein
MTFVRPVQHGTWQLATPTLPHDTALMPRSLRGDFLSVNCGREQLVPAEGHAVLRGSRVCAFAQAYGCTAPPSRCGPPASVVIGCRRFISPAAIAEFVAKSTTTISPSLASTRSCLRPSGTGLATTDLTSRPDCTGSESISCIVASVCLQPGPLGARHR